MLLKKKNIKPGRGVVTSSIILVTIFDLLAIYYFKYENQGLPLKYFNLHYIGNILNLFFTLVLVLGLIVYNFKSRNGYRTGLVITLTIISNIFLLAAILSLKINFPLPHVYFFEHPLQKIFTGILYSLFQYTQFVFMSLLWYSVLGKELFILRAFVNSFLIIFFLLAFTFIFVNLKKNNKEYSVKNSNNLRKESVAVVLGAAVWSHNAPSPSLAARADKAAQLYHKGVVNRIQVTGSNTPGEMTEAEVAYNYLINQNIKPSDVWIEKNTVSTAEQVKFIRDNLLSKINYGKIIVVSDAYHLSRVREICNFFHIKAGYAASDLKLKFDHNLYYKLKESIALLVFWFFAV
jgi:SanA protein